MARSTAKQQQRQDAAPDHRASVRIACASARAKPRG
jgi:hypothetical protein